MTRRVVFAGTPGFAVPSLAALIAAPVDVVAVFTQPDRPSGRGRKLRPGPVKELALAHNIDVFQPASLKGELLHEWTAIPCDLAVVAAYGLILPRTALDSPRLGCINVHASLLPRWRGAAPINRAIEAGDCETGVTLMQMDTGLDTGDMLARVVTPITDACDALALHDQLARLGATLLAEHLDDIFAQSLVRSPQDDAHVTYANKLSRDESALDWTMSARELDRKIRALVPWPCTTALHAGTRLKIHGSALSEQSAVSGIPGEICALDEHAVHVVTGDGVLALTRLQRPGSRALPAREFLHGYALHTGEIFEADVPPTAETVL